MKRIDSLLDKDLHLVERRKTIFLIPLGIVVVAAIMMIIFNFTLGSPLYLGTDFAGGFSVSVGLGSKLTDENYQEYCDKIEAALTEVPALEGDGKYNVRVDNMQKQGSGSDFKPLSDHPELTSLGDFPLQMAYVHKNQEALLVLGQEPVCFMVLTKTDAKGDLLEKLQEQTGLAFHVGF